MALYGSIPYMMAHSEYRTVGVFWNNAAETWVDVASSKSVLNSLLSIFKTTDVPTMDTHWMSESGIMDLFVMMGPKPHDVSNQYSTLTGSITLPPVSFFIKLDNIKLLTVIFNLNYISVYAILSEGLDIGVNNIFFLSNQRFN